MAEAWLVLRRANAHDLGAVAALLGDATRWLRDEKPHTDQWADPWPDEDARNERIRRAVEAGRTWLAWHAARPAAMLTASPNDQGIWPHETRRDRAVYVRRLVVARRYAGRGLGGQLLDWAGLRASRDYGARWVRVDVWTTNAELHRYYEQQGFEFCGFCEHVVGYPSTALFQKRTEIIVPPDPGLFREVG